MNRSSGALELRPHQNQALADLTPGAIDDLGGVVRAERGTNSPSPERQPAGGRAVSTKHSLISDRCGAVVAAASTLALASADAAALGAVRLGRHDVCHDCSTGCAEATTTRRSTSVHESIDPTAEVNACARCPLPGCGSDLYISTHSSRPVFLSDTSDDLANAAPFTSTWEIGCGEGHVLLLPSGADDHDTFGQARDDDEPGDDLARLRRLIAQGPAAAATWAIFDRWATDDFTPPSEPVVGSVGASRDAVGLAGLDRTRSERAPQSEADDRG